MSDLIQQIDISSKKYCNSNTQTTQSYSVEGIILYYITCSIYFQLSYVGSFEKIFGFFMNSTLFECIWQRIGTNIKIIRDSRQINRQVFCPYYQDRILSTALADRQVSRSWLQAESNFVGNLGLPIFIKRRSKRSTLSFLNK